MSKLTFRKDLETLINSHSVENGSNTPDFMLADYLMNCLEVWEETVNKREKWYGRKAVFPFDEPAPINIPLRRQKIDEPAPINIPLRRQKIDEPAPINMPPEEITIYGDPNRSEPKPSTIDLLYGGRSIQEELEQDRVGGIF